VLDRLTNIMKVLKDFALSECSITLSVVGTAEANDQLREMKLGTEMCEASPLTRKFCKLEGPLSKDSVS
jgi:hypothetical protein